MKNSSVLLQSGLLVVGVCLLYFYVRPVFSDISDSQDTLLEYSNAIAEAMEVNQMLSSLVESIEQIPQPDREALDAYLPTTVDPIAVQRDLKAYVDRSPLVLDSISQADTGGTSFVTQDSSQADNSVSNSAAPVDTVPVTEVYFNLSVTGSYADIKQILFDIEMNSYPIHLKTIDLTGAETGVLQADMSFVTYEFNEDQS